MAQRKETDWREFTIHHTESVKVNGLTVSEVAALAITDNIPPEATLVSWVDYDENGPEVFLRWNVSVAEMERMDRA